MACVSTKPEAGIIEQAGGSARSGRIKHRLLNTRPAAFHPERISKIASNQFPINFLPEAGMVSIQN